MKNPVLPRIIADHLGSIRVTLDQSGNIDSWTDFYPYGLESRGSSSTNEPKEGFSGKQFDEEIDYNYFGARYYNPQIARWMSVDPLSGKYPGLTPYNFVGGNPIVRVEMDGRFWSDVHKKLIEEAFKAVYPHLSRRLPSPSSAAEGMNRAISQSWRQDTDIFHYKSAEHADNSSFSETFKMAESLLGDASFEAVGIALHGIQDFYSHSNFSTVAAKVFGEQIVTFEEAMQNSEFADLWMKEGMSGEYGDGADPSSPTHHDNVTYDYFPDRANVGANVLTSGNASRRTNTPGYAKEFWRRYEMAKKHSTEWLRKWEAKRWREGSDRKDRFEASEN